MGAYEERIETLEALKAMEPGLVDRMNAIMKAPLSGSGWDPESRKEIDRRQEEVRRMWADWSEQRTMLDKKVAEDERKLAEKAEKEAEREAAAAQGKTVLTIKGNYRAPKASAPRNVVKKEATPKGERVCRACDKPIPASGKRGRPAVYHDTCRPS